MASAEVLTGCVKWFNHNLNYGFITVLTDGEYNKADIFVHQSNIKTKNDCYRTLTAGECVQFEIAKSDNTAHPINAVNVSGFNGGLLNCETARPRNFNGDGSRGRGGRGRGSSRGRNDSSSRSDSERENNYHNHNHNHNRNDSYSRNLNTNSNFARQPYVSRNTNTTAQTDTTVQTDTTMQTNHNVVAQNTQVDIIDSVVITSADTSLQADTTTTPAPPTATVVKTRAGRGRKNNSS